MNMKLSKEINSTHGKYVSKAGHKTSRQYNGVGSYGGPDQIHYEILVSSIISCNDLYQDFIIMFVWYFVSRNSISV